MIVTLINSHLRAPISLHNNLHGFGKGGVVGTNTLEAKLDQQLAVIFHEPLLQVFLGVRKAYDLMNITMRKEFVWGYGLVATLQQTLKSY